MKLGQLLEGIDIINTAGDFAGEVSTLCYSADKCEQGSLFVAITGLKHDGHDFIAIVEHEGIAIRVADEIESLDRPTRTGIKGLDEAARTIEPDKGGVALGGKLGDPFGIWFTVLVAACLVAWLIDHPDERGGRAISRANLDHAQGRGPDEVSPPLVVLVLRDAEVLPLAQGRPAGNYHMIGAARHAEQQTC